MCKKRRPINCIVPPHILEAMLNSDDASIRDSALRTLTTSARIRGEREIVGAIRSAMITNPIGKKHRSIHDAKNERLSPSQLPGTSVRDEDQTASSDASVNQAYEALGATYDFYRNVLGRNSIDGHGTRLVATVHFSKKFNNAFWNGKQMVFGDGDNIIFRDFTRSLDVVGHELAHGVTEFTAGLEYHNQSGALNESFSDVFGSLVKQYARKQRTNEADWLIGSEIMAPGINGVALRSMKNPGSAYDDPRLGGKDPQPKHMSDFVKLPDDDEGDNGGVHINSGIPNYVFYLVARRLGGYAWEQAGAIWYQTLQQLSPLAEFQDCADISAQVAGAKFGHGSKQQDAVIAAWDEVGINITVPDLLVTSPQPSYRSNGSELRQRLESISEQLRETVNQIGA
ncbi:MAG TPA: M4 family metallopeptidase [Pyrinomonadaceae bacterium]|nr:M4 family metallopeptidase [Pyrinomonadaceae bacterium]